jgi:Activator of Hsp90 ATPase homolog 1-like protein
MEAASVGPIVLTVKVSCSPEQAFEVFTAGFGEWWPYKVYSIGRARTQAAVFEGWTDGRVYEVMEGGEEAQWGRVTGWDPPSRIELAWQTNPRAPGPTRVTVTFRPEGSSGTIVELVHGGWEIYGDQAPIARDEYETGWPGTLDLFARAASGSGRG